MQNWQSRQKYKPLATNTEDAYNQWQDRWDILSGMTGSEWDPEEITFMGKHIDWAATQGSKEKKKQEVETDNAWSNYLHLAGIDPNSEAGTQPSWDDFKWTKDLSLEKHGLNSVPVTDRPDQFDTSDKLSSSDQFDISDKLYPWNSFVTEQEFQKMKNAGLIKEDTEYNDMVETSLTNLGNAFERDGDTKETLKETLLHESSHLPENTIYNDITGEYEQQGPVTPAGSGLQDSILTNMGRGFEETLGSEGMELTPTQMLNILQNWAGPNILDMLINKAPTSQDPWENAVQQKDTLIASAGNLTGLLGERDTTTDAKRIAKQEQVIKDKAGFGIVRPQDRMRNVPTGTQEMFIDPNNIPAGLEKKDPGVFNTITDWISDRVGGAKATSAEIALSSLTGKTTQGDFTKDQLLKFGTNRAGTDLITQRHEAVRKENPKKFDTPFGDPQIPFYRGEKPTISDDSLYIDSRTGEALPQTDATRVDFPDHSVQYGDSGQIGGRGALQAFVHQKDPWSMPTFNVHDIAGSNFASKDSGEFSAGGLGSKVTEGVAKGLAWLGGSKWSDRQSEGVNVGGVSHKQGSLPYTEWSPEMKQAYAPHLEFKTDGRLGHGALSPDYDNPDWNEQVSSALKAFDSGPPQEGMEFWSEVMPAEKWDYGGDLKGEIPDALTWGWEYPTSNQDNLTPEEAGEMLPVWNQEYTDTWKKWEEAAKNSSWFNEGTGELDNTVQTITNSWANQAPAGTRFEYTGEGTKKYGKNLWGINPGKLAKSSGGGTSANSWDKYANFGH